MSFGQVRVLGFLEDCHDGVVVSYRRVPSESRIRRQPL